MKLAHAFVLALVVAALFAGCTSYRPLQIEPVGKKSLAIVPKFTDSYYYFDRDQNLFVVMRSRTTDAATNKPVDQVFIARIFWRPIGGKTSMNITSLNATYRYALMTPDSVGMYEGAGFIRLTGKNGEATLKCRLMDGDLRLTQASASFVDTLGRAHVQGNFSATYDDARAMGMLMDAHREFFARSLLSKPAPAATQPGEPREEDFPTAPEPGPAPTTTPGSEFVPVAPPTTAPATQP